HSRRDETGTGGPARDRRKASFIRCESRTKEDVGPTVGGNAFRHWLRRRYRARFSNSGTDGSEWEQTRVKPVAATRKLADIISLEEQFQLATYKKMPVVAERGEGVWIYTSDGQRYLDLYGGHAVAGTGHCHPHVVKAIREQTEKLLFYSNLVYSQARARAAKKLVSVAPDSLTKAFFCNSGTEANENAMRMARMATA